MTEKEYEEAIATQNAIIHSHEKEINVARRKKREVTEVFEQSLSDRYADFVGKKVEITFSIPTGRGDCTIKTVTGFLSGFKYGGYTLKIRPILAKVKKDGSASLNHYSDLDLASYKYISNIKIVE